MKLIKEQKFVLLLLVINFIFLLPSLFEPISYGDECIYLTLGNAFRRGLVFYRDIHDNKPPLLYLVAALSGGTLWAFRSINIIWQLIHLFVVLKLVKVITKSRLALLVSGFLFIIASLIFEGRVANGETFMMMPVTFAVYLLISRPKENRFPLGLLCGVLFSLGFLLKIPVVFDFVGVTFAYFFLKLPFFSLRNIGKVLTNIKLWGLVSGFVIPILTSIIYYWSKRAFIPYVRSALMQNIGYLSSWQGSNNGLLTRLAILAILAIAIFVLRKRLSFYHAFFFTWYLFSLFGALLSGRPYPHYLAEIVPSFSILLGICTNEIMANDILRGLKRLLTVLALPLIAIVLLAFSYSYFHFWWYPQFAYYRNFLLYASGSINKDTYLNYWGDKTKDDYRIANLLRESTLPIERVFVWGDGACIYAISNRLPPGKYTVNYHISDFNGYDETLKSIVQNKPRFIVKLKGETRVWPQLNNVLEESYVPFSFDNNIPSQTVKDQVYIRSD